MRRFNLHRVEDATGVSGTGVVAQGVEFDDGTCAMRWLTATASTAFYTSAADLLTIHGHEGRTQLVYLDAGPGTTGPGIQVRYQPAPADAAAYARSPGRRTELIARLRRASPS